uniref:Insulin-like growth factor-binding protein 2-B n=1 Tax=Salarias fasciatus TaxID=181472 RepID=A0A672IB12_SALFA
MIIYFTYGFLFAYVTLPGVLLGDLVFRCPSCTAERLATCPKVTALCAEIVREPGCGCCPVCARTEGELCGVYTPRCSSGLRCYPSVDAELPLRQLIQGLGRCGQKVDVDVSATDHQAANEVVGTESPFTRRPAIDAWIWQQSAKKQEEINRKTKMRQMDESRTQWCNMSTHGQRGECWCVNPLTGVHIPETPIVRGDPNCDQFQELLRAMPTAAPSR